MTDDYTPEITTAFERQYHYSLQHTAPSGEEYTRNVVDIHNAVYGMVAIYQNGLSFINGSHGSPSVKVELSSEGGTDWRLVKVDEMGIDGIESIEQDDLKDLIDSFQLPTLKTRDDLRSLYLALKQNHIDAEAYNEKHIKTLPELPSGIKFWN